MDKIKVLIKRTASYFKRNWDFEDYPTKTWKNPNARKNNVAYGAGIINWDMMVAHGETSEKALEALRDKFKIHKEKHKNLPRPGKKIQIVFASTEKINKYEKTAVDFFRNILDIDYYSGFFSDLSSLSDFIISFDNEELGKMKEQTVKQILMLYNVDINDIYHEPLWKIFERIETKK
jgi:predicted RNase H-like HicB family nuclease